MDEEQAIVKLKQGNIQGLEFLVNQFYFPAVHSAYLIVQDKALAEDVVQNVFLELPKKIDHFNTGYAFRPWFLKCIVNAAINTATRQSRFTSLNLDLEERGKKIDELFLGFENSPEDQVISEEKQQMVWKALHQLSPQQRAVIVMRYYLQMSEEEIVNELDISKSSIKWRLHSAKNRLKNILHPFKPVVHSTNDGYVKKE